MPRQRSLTSSSSAVSFQGAVWVFHDGGCRKLVDGEWKVVLSNTEWVAPVANLIGDKLCVFHVDAERTLDDFAEGRTDVLLGTQMIAKGLDFPNVAMVGVACADLSLSLPDFRAAERTFQLVAQVAGRAGRADHAGVVVV